MQGEYVWCIYKVDVCIIIYIFICENYIYILFASRFGDIQNCMKAVYDSFKHVTT